MTKNAAKPRYRIRTPADIVDAVPYLLGFQPANSLVVLSLRGERSRIGLTARVDLPGPADAVQCARAFVGYLARDKAARAIVVLYPPGGGPAHSSVRPLADALVEQLGAAGIDAKEVLCVGDGRWWSLCCTDDECCPSSGTPIAAAGTSAAAAAMAFAGVAVLQSRKELEHTIALVNGAVRAAMEYALPRAIEGLVERHAITSRAQVVAESIELFRAAVHQRIASAAEATPPSIDDAARLIVGLDDVPARDEVLAWFDGEWGRATRDLLIELVRRAVPPFDVPALTTLAWICYLQGDGALAGIALDRARAADPTYSLAQILNQALAAPLDPAVFRKVLPLARKADRRPSTSRRGVAARPPRPRLGRSDQV
jgi:hypothetical protein